MKLDLEAIKAREKAASPWPWTVQEWRMVAGPEVVPGSGPCMVIYDEGGHSEEDAEFIAHARTDIPALIARVEELEKEIKEIHQNARDNAFERDLQ